MQTMIWVNRSLGVKNSTIESWELALKVWNLALGIGNTILGVRELALMVGNLALGWRVLITGAQEILYQSTQTWQ